MSSSPWSALQKLRAARPPSLQYPRVWPGPTADEPLRPSRIGEYRVLGRLGVSDGGPVYLAEEPNGLRVAARTLGHGSFARWTEPTTAQPDEASARQVARFCNGDVLWIGVDSDVTYVVTRFDGYRSLPHLVEATRSLTEADLHIVALSCLSSLAALHRAGRVHGAFGPANVLIGTDGPVVIDFELDPDPAVVAQLRFTGPPPGSFTTPEQVLGGTVGPPTDLFAWASTMVYAATGHAPFLASNEVAQKQKVAYWHPELIAVPMPLASILAACLSKAPKRRPSAEETLLWLVDNVQSGVHDGASAPALVLEMVELARARRNQGLAGRWEESPPTDPVHPPRSVPTALVSTPGSVGNAELVDAEGTDDTESRAAPADRSGIAPPPARVSRRLGYLGAGLLVIVLMLGVSNALFAPFRRAPDQQRSAPGTSTAASAPSPRPTGGTKSPPRETSAGPTSSQGPLPGSRTHSPAPSSPASPAPSAPTTPPAFTGTWIGTLFQPPGSRHGHKVTITMSSGARTAAYVLPNLGCQAVLTVTGVSRQSTQLHLVERITRDQGRVCAPTARLTLTLTGNLSSGQHQLTVQWQDAANQDNTAAGNLTRQ